MKHANRKSCTFSLFFSKLSLCILHYKVIVLTYNGFRNLPQWARTQGWRTVSLTSALPHHKASSAWRLGCVVSSVTTSHATTLWRYTLPKLFPVSGSDNGPSHTTALWRYTLPKLFLVSGSDNGPPHATALWRYSQNDSWWAAVIMVPHTRQLCGGTHSPGYSWWVAVITVLCWRYTLPELLLVNGSNGPLHAMALWRYTAPRLFLVSGSDIGPSDQWKLKMFYQPVRLVHMRFCRLNLGKSSSLKELLWAWDFPPQSYENPLAQRNYD